MTSDLQAHVERLWQLDILPFNRSVTRSRQDQYAVKLLEAKTKRVAVDGISRYATPMLRANDGTVFQATKEAVMPSLKRIEKRLLSRPLLAKVHNEQIQNLVDTGKVKLLTEPEVINADEAWYFPHHVVYANGKHR